MFFNWLKQNILFNKYYLLVFTVIVLTITIQSIIQFSLAQQRHDALRINVAGRQRMLSQMIVKNIYQCRYSICDYDNIRLEINELSFINEALQKGSATMDLEPLTNVDIQNNFDKLQPHLNYILNTLKNFKELEKVSIEELSAEVDQFLLIMDKIVTQFQKASEKEIKALMNIELELAVFSLLILIIEIFFFINPSIKKIAVQNKKLKEISWHQTRAFKSHMTNIKNFHRVIEIEKNVEYKEEMIAFLMEELKDLEDVSNNMVKSLEKEQ
tara:strand:+ start:225 stop:1034 length:810 start_codon:yes stop_codon:yes gene_type:complete